MKNQISAGPVQRLNKSLAPYRVYNKGQKLDVGQKQGQKLEVGQGANSLYWLGRWR